MAQPGGLARSEPLRLEQQDGVYSPVDAAMRRALHLS